jgi:hypothetical protein
LENKREVVVCIFHYWVSIGFKRMIVTTILVSFTTKNKKMQKTATQSNDNAQSSNIA